MVFPQLCRIVIIDIAQTYYFKFFFKRNLDKLNLMNLATPVTNIFINSVLLQIFKITIKLHNYYFIKSGVNI
jgi:hypothetical protein